MDRTFRGYFAIALTPFDAMGDLLWEDLARECDWIARAGGHGVVWPVNDSEQYALSAAERVRGYEVVMQAVRGRIPVVAGVADTSKAGAVAFAEAAARAGVDAVIAVPPWSVKMTSPALIEDYYRAVAEAAGLPLFIQNLGGMMGSSLSSAHVAELCRRIPLAQYVKEERDPHGDNVSELIDLREPAIKGVFTGGHKLSIVTAHKRGAAGTMASADVTDLCSRMWDLMEAGNEVEARKVLAVEALLHRAMMDMAYHAGLKEVLVSRGIFNTNSRRSLGTVRFDRFYMEELEDALRRAAPYLRG